MAHHCLDTHSIGIARGRLEDQTVDLQHTSERGGLTSGLHAIVERDQAENLRAATRTGSSGWFLVARRGVGCDRGQIWITDLVDNVGMDCTARLLSRRKLPRRRRGMALGTEEMLVVAGQATEACLGAEMKGCSGWWHTAKPNRR